MPDIYSVSKNYIERKASNLVTLSKIDATNYTLLVKVFDSETGAALPDLPIDFNLSQITSKKSTLEAQVSRLSSLITTASALALGEVAVLLAGVAEVGVEKLSDSMCSICVHMFNPETGSYLPKMTLDFNLSTVTAKRDTFQAQVNELSTLISDATAL